MVELQPSKLVMRVRFPSPALLAKAVCISASPRPLRGERGRSRAETNLPPVVAVELDEPDGIVTPRYPYGQAVCRWNRGLGDLSCHGDAADPVRVLGKPHSSVGARRDVPGTGLGGNR